MKFIAKYGIGLYLLVSLMFKLKFLIPVEFTRVAFYILMGCGLIVIPVYIKVLYNNKSIKVFWLFHLVTLINLIYLVIFKYDNSQSWLYFLSKYATFNLIILGLIYNFDFYKDWITRNFKYLILVMLLLGMTYGARIVHDDRLSIGFNANDVGQFSFIGLFAIISLNHEWQKKKILLTLVILFSLAALLSGSRGAILTISLSVLFFYGLSFKTIGLAILFSFVIYLSGNLGYTTGISRLSGKEGTFQNRNDEYEAGLLTFYDEFYTGNGLHRYGWANPKHFPDPRYALGPHNTYIATGIMYGVVFGSIFLFSIFRFIFNSWKTVKRKGDEFVKFCYYFLIIMMVNAFFETLIVGINEFITILFWLFIGVVSIFSYRIPKPNVSGN